MPAAEFLSPHPLQASSRVFFAAPGTPSRARWWSPERAPGGSPTHPAQRAPRVSDRLRALPADARRLCEAGPASDRWYQGPGTPAEVKGAAVEAAARQGGGAGCGAAGGAAATGGGAGRGGGGPPTPGTRANMTAKTITPLLAPPAPVQV